MNFTNLNKYYPKDDLSLHRMDTLIELTARCKMLSLFNFFSDIIQLGWHPRMKKTSFTTPWSPNVSSKWQRVSDLYGQFF